MRGVFSFGIARGGSAPRVRIAARAFAEGRGIRLASVGACVAALRSESSVHCCRKMSLNHSAAEARQMHPPSRFGHWKSGQTSGLQFLQVAVENGSPVQTA